MIQVSTSGAPNIICHSKYSGASKLAETLVFHGVSLDVLFVFMLFCCLC